MTCSRLLNRRKISDNVVKDMMQDLDLKHYVETSAKDKSKAEKLFFEAANISLEHYKSQNNRVSKYTASTSGTEWTIPKRKSGCCG